MRILVTGDRRWYSPELAARVLSRMIARYGRDIVIVHGAATGIDQSFAEACAKEGRNDFMFTVAPLRIPRGTSSVVNPLAIF